MGETPSRRLEGRCEVVQGTKRPRTEVPTNVTLASVAPGITLIPQQFDWSTFSQIPVQSIQAFSQPIGGGSWNNTFTLVGDVALSGQQLTEVGGQNAELVGTIIESAPQQNTCLTQQQENWSTDVLQVFSCVTAVLEESFIRLIQENKDVMFSILQEKYNVKFQIDENSYSILCSGNAKNILNTEKELEKYLKKPTESSNNDNERKDSSTQTENFTTIGVDKCVECDIKIPFITQFGREVRLPPKFGNYMNDSDEDNEKSDKNDTHYTPVSSNIPLKKRGPGRKNNNISTNLIKSGPSKEESNDSQSNFTEDVDEQAPKSVKIGNRSIKSMIKREYESKYAFKHFCHLCSFKSKRASHYNKHLQLHASNQEILKCDKCDFKTIRVLNLRKHEISEHTPELFNCTKCNYKTDSHKLLLKHKKQKHSGIDVTHRNKKMSGSMRRSCPKCSFHTSSSKVYYQHLLKHGKGVAEGEGFTMNDAFFFCSICSYKSKAKAHIDRHILTVHKNNRPFLCDLCGRSFKRTDALKVHKLTHIDKSARTYRCKCPTCGKGFTAKAHLHDHMSIHSSVKSHLCDICGAAFKTHPIRQKHMQLIHLNPRSFRCDFCDKRFNTKYAMLRHKKVHDNAPPQQQYQEIPIEQLTEVDPQDIHSLRTANGQVMVQDVIAPIEETFYQTHDAINQAFIPSNENEATTATLYLTDSINSMQTY